MCDSGADVEKGTAAAKKEDKTEAEIVDWSGPDDPGHPQYWPLKRKLYIGFIFTIITMIVSINSSIYSTGAAQVEQELGLSAELNVLGTSLFLVVSAALLQSHFVPSSF